MASREKRSCWNDFGAQESGAKSLSGASFSDIAQVSQKVINSMVTIAASLENCSVPGRGEDGLEFLNQMNSRSAWEFVMSQGLKSIQFSNNKKSY